MKEFELKEKIKNLERKLEQYELESVGIYAPKHALNTRSEFGEAIRQNLKEQRECSKVKNLFTTTGTIQNILVQNFNFECSEIIRKLNGYNLQSAKLKIQEKANKMLDVCDEYGILVSNHNLFNLKIEQAKLENDYLLFQAEEKYRKQEQARKIAEQRKADKEWFDRLVELEKRIQESISNGNIEETERLQEEANQTRYLLKEKKAGWVYIISNEDMHDGYYKVGTTRRISPLVRIDELSDASHAFKFRIHALIYSEDCFGLESRLHRRLTNCRVNKENLHKEFFEIDLEELQIILLDEFGIDVEMNENIYEDDEKLNALYSFIYDK
jgi:hypothetical protein